MRIREGYGQYIIYGRADHSKVKYSISFERSHFSKNPRVQNIVSIVPILVVLCLDMAEILEQSEHFQTYTYIHTEYYRQTTSCNPPVHAQRVNN